MWRKEVNKGELRKQSKRCPRLNWCSEKEKEKYFSDSIELFQVPLSCNFFLAYGSSVFTLPVLGNHQSFSCERKQFAAAVGMDTMDTDFLPPVCSLYHTSLQTLVKIRSPPHSRNILLQSIWSERYGKQTNSICKSEWPRETIGCGWEEKHLINFILFSYFIKFAEGAFTPLWNMKTNTLILQKKQLIPSFYPLPLPSFLITNFNNPFQLLIRADGIDPAEAGCLLELTCLG